MNDSHTHDKRRTQIKGAYSAASDLELGGGGALLDLHGGGILPVKIYSR